MEKSPWEYFRAAMFISSRLRAIRLEKYREITMAMDMTAIMVRKNTFINILYAPVMVEESLDTNTKPIRLWSSERIGSDTTMHTWS